MWSWAGGAPGIGEPRGDGATIPAGHAQLGHLGFGEQTDLLVLMREDQFGVGLRVATVRDDEDVLLGRVDVVHPRVEDRPGSDLPLGLLVDLPSYTLFRCFADLDATAR